MNKVLIGIISVFAAIAVLLMGSCAYVVSINNREVDLRVAIVAKQKDNQSEFDNMWKKIAQVAEVSQEEKSALMQVFNDYAHSRSGNGGGSFATAITEAVPSVNFTNMTNLVNTVTSSRDAWTFRQKELLDLSREHNKLLQRFPSGFLLGLFGRTEIDVEIITSSKTTETFERGTDDDVQLFRK